MQEPVESDILIHGHTYDLWRDGQYLGQAQFIEDDPNIGDSFQVIDTVKKERTVFIADKWKLL